MQEFSEENQIVEKRIVDIQSGKVKGLPEAEYYNYLKKRGIKISE